MLDVAGNNWTGNPQLAMALDRIHTDDSITALYGFSGGGYNARHLYAKLTPSERKAVLSIGTDEEARAVVARTKRR